MIRRFAISKSCKRILIALLVVFLMIEAVQYDLGDSVALWSHLRHGFRGQCCGIEVKAPLRYWAQRGRPDDLSLFSTPGYLRTRLFHSPHAIILISSISPPLDEEHMRQASERYAALWARTGYRPVGAKTIQVAGHPMACVELYTEHFNIFGPDYDVWCTGQDIRASFSGSPALLSEFYNILEEATPTIELNRTTK